MADLLTDRTAVVTGGASGIGRAIALGCAEAGADVVVADLTDEPREGGTPTHEAVRSETNADADYVECDVTSAADLQEAVAAAEAFGGVDVMVNNAGIVRLESFLEVSEDDYETVMGVNAKGVFFGAQAAARAMVEDEREGAIVNMSSIAGLEGAGDYVTYSGSKGAVRLMTYAQADALAGTGIRVNAVHPGPVSTELMREDLSAGGTDAETTFEAGIPVGRMGRPEDVADATVFLASDMAAFVNGASLVVDGGMYSTRGTVLTD
jgi:NAD(P)-dependent dehydrogenase (short-subunit alcohol dehydrogenase family)